MAFRHIPGNSQYEYDQSPPDPGAGHPMRALWQKSANGIRTEHGQSNYVRCRRIGSGDVDHGEISKSYWDLRSSVSSYGILAFEPSLILDFKASVFNKNGVSSTFGTSITHAATTNATMVDSDGLLKWRPHNLLTRSGDLTSGSWTNNALTVTTGQNDFEGNPTAFKLTPTAVSGLHRFYKTQVISNLVNGELTTVTIDLKADGYNFFSIASGNTRYAIINLSDGTVSADANSVSPTVTSLGNGWYRCSITTSVVSQEVFSVGETSEGNTFGSQTFTGDGTSGVLVAYPHTHRSDLGGMVNNPDRGDSYVPTTTTPVYLSRRGHHIYNGSAWVNEGILHESEARTNLMTYSGDLSGTGWSGGGSTIGAVIAGSPFGTYQTFSPSASGATPAIRRQLGKPATSGATYVGWSLVKYSAGSGWFAISMHDTGKGDERAWFDLQNGVVGTKEPLIIDHGMVDYGDGWWLCWSSANAASTSAGCAVNITNGDGVFSRTQTDVILIAGTQFELGATPSSYIPTTTASVTRAAETLTVPTANIPYDSTNMSFQMDGKMTYVNSGAVETVGFFRWYLNSGTNIMTRLNTNGIKIGNVYTTGVGYNLPNVYNPGFNVPFNIAARYGSTFTNLATDGTAYTASTYNSASDNLSSTNLNLGQAFMGTIRQYRMWSDDITDAGITEAST